MTLIDQLDAAAADVDDLTTRWNNAAPGDKADARSDLMEAYEDLRDAAVAVVAETNDGRRTPAP